jgi:hypothetical protein
MTPLLEPTEKELSRIRRQNSLTTQWRIEIDAIKKSGKRITDFDIAREMLFASQDEGMKPLTHFEKWCIAEIELLKATPA